MERKRRLEVLEALLNGANNSDLEKPVQAQIQDDAYQVMILAHVTELGVLPLCYCGIQPTLDGGDSIHSYSDFSFGMYTVTMQAKALSPLQRPRSWMDGIPPSKHVVLQVLSRQVMDGLIARRGHLPEEHSLVFTRMHVEGQSQREYYLKESAIEMGNERLEDHGLLQKK